MTCNEYQLKAAATFIVEGEMKIPYLALGLVGEAGEVAEKIKKAIRNHNSDFSKLDRDDLKRELGDVLWYIATLSRELGLELDDVVTTNLEKLSDRKERGAIASTGDYR